MGHADVFACAGKYEPIKDVAPSDLGKKHRSLSELAAQLLDQECAKLGVKVTSPPDYDHRGGHLAFSHPGAGSITEALLAHGVVSSFRKPDNIRFGLHPLALSHEESPGCGRCWRRRYGGIRSTRRFRFSATRSKHLPR